MATPRADQTLGQRVKQLEEAFRRIKLVPSTTQTAVAPSAAVKGAVWIDSSAGNEPKVWDGTAWVPVRDATIAVAQGTADTAQATVAPLIPLTDLAAVTTGLVVTGATNVTTDPGTGAHVVVNDPAYPGQIALYSGNANEVVPGRIMPVLGGANYGKVELRSPDLVGTDQYSFIELDGFNDGTTSMESSADTMRVVGGDTTVMGTAQVRVGDGTDYVTFVGQAVTDADLSSLTNTFPIFPYYSCYLAANQTVATGTSVAPTWTDDATSPSSGITRSSGVFTVPTDGRYRVTLQAYWNAIASPAGSRIAQVYTGNVIGSGNPLVSAAEQPSAVAASACLAVKTVRLAAGAQINTVVSHTQGASMTNGLLGSANGNLTYFQIEWVGP